MEGTKVVILKWDVDEDGYPIIGEKQVKIFHEKAKEKFKDCEVFSFYGGNIEIVDLSNI